MTMTTTKPDDTNGAAPQAAPEPTGAMTLAASATSVMTLGTDAYRGALEPASLNDAVQLAQLMASISYCGVKSYPEALGRIMTGRGLGLSAMQSMRGVYSVEGRPGLDASLMQALCQQSPLCEYFNVVPNECDDTKATYVAKRVGCPEVKWVYTIEAAQKAGLLDRGADEEKKKRNNWNARPGAMLRARCKSELARMVFPDIIFGMYSREELMDGEVPHDDPNEMAGEIVAQEEAAIAAARGGGPVMIVQGAVRNYHQEAEVLKEKILQAGSSRQARSVVRAEIEKWDAIEPYKSQVAEFYSKTKPQRASEATAPVQPTSIEKPAPVPEGNLFGQTDAKEPSST